jgi:hypothetical protein
LILRSVNTCSRYLISDLDIYRSKIVIIHTYSKQMDFITVRICVQHFVYMLDGKKRTFILFSILGTGISPLQNQFRILRPEIKSKWILGPRPGVKSFWIPKMAPIVWALTFFKHEMNKSSVLPGVTKKSSINLIIFFSFSA